MHALVPNRGPDGEGFMTAGTDFAAHRHASLHAAPPAVVALAFRWLVVQDPAPEAAQPMASADGKAWLIFNGEIYNFPELREELERDGFAFRSHSDGEVLLAAYQKWGTGCFARFNGMWAVVIVDLARRVAVLSRDRFGIRPLFYAERQGRIDVASEVKQLLAVAPSVAANEKYLEGFLRRGTLHHFDQETFFVGIRSVPPATFAVTSLDGPQTALQFETYWDAADYQTPARRPFDQLAEELGEVLRDAVKLTLRTQASTVSFLSGGLDSSVATALMRETDPRDFEACSIEFPSYPAFDESRWIADFERMHGVRVARATLDAAYVRDKLRDVTWAHEEPLIASAQIAQSRAFQLVAERGARVVIDGQGSDELLAGYPDHELLMWRSRVTHGRWIDAAREGMILGRKLGRRALASVLLRRNGHETEDRGNDPTAVGQAIYADLKYRRLRPILHNADRNGMAYSIESRLPYLDHRVVELALSIPSEMKVGFGERKRALRAVARDRVPRSYLERRDKMGFMTPEPLWLRNELAGDVKRALADERLRQVPHFDLDRARRIAAAYRAGKHRDFRAVWRVYALPAWLEVYGLL
jgi:asparagine synthase (glutamine-hydrolysing)